MSTKKNKILILLLAGGLSRRFGGGIKTFAKINGVTIFEKIISGFKKQGVRILINANSNHKIFLNIQRCLYDEDISTQESCTANGVFAPLFGIIGSIQANEALKVILDTGATVQGKLLLVDALNMEFNEAVLKKDPECPVCN